MAIYTSVLTAGTNSHQETSENVNAVATDFVSQGVIGAITNTSGVAPSTGAFAVNAQGTPDMTVAVSSGVAYVTATPSSQDSQNLRVRNTASTNVTISANTSGSTKYDWLYIKIDATKAANPAADASDVATLVTSRSSSSTTDNGTPPTYGYCIAVITVANNASSITNGNIADKRGLANTVPSKTVPASSLSTDSTWVWTSYTPTQTGWSSTTILTGRYVQTGKTVIFVFDVSGTSNSAAATLTLPVACANFPNIYYENILTTVTDNGTNPTTVGKTFVNPSISSTVMNLFKDITGTPWTSSGLKAMRGTLIYEAA